jgi:hypothetical protein
MRVSIHIQYAHRTEMRRKPSISDQVGQSHLFSMIFAAASSPSPLFQSPKSVYHTVTHRLRPSERNVSVTLSISRAGTSTPLVKPNFYGNNREWIEIYTQGVCRWSRGSRLEFGCTGAGGLATHHLPLTFAKAREYSISLFGHFTQVR